MVTSPQAYFSCLLLCVFITMANAAPKKEYYEDSFVSEDGNTRGSVKVSKDGRTVSSSSRSSVSGKGGSASVSVSSSSVSSSGARAHGRSAATTKVDGEKHTYSAKVDKDFDIDDFMDESFKELRRKVR